MFSRILGVRPTKVAESQLGIDLVAASHMKADPSQLRRVMMEVEETRYERFVLTAKPSTNDRREFAYQKRLEAAMAKLVDVAEAADDLGAEDALVKAFALVRSVHSDLNDERRQRAVGRHSAVLKRPREEAELLTQEETDELAKAQKASRGGSRSRGRFRGFSAARRRDHAVAPTPSPTPYVPRGRAGAGFRSFARGGRGFASGRRGGRGRAA